MKKLLFLYPVEEIMQPCWGHKPHIYPLLNETINERYREKGYQIIFVTFKNKPVFGMDIYNHDRVIETDITLEEHKTPIGKDENGKYIYKYPSNEYLEQQLGEFQELVVGGFHSHDCVIRVAEYFYNINPSTIVDEELTNLFGGLSARFYFNKEKYNLANKLIYDRAEDIFLHGREHMNSDYKERYSKPYFHVEQFIEDFTLEECLLKLIQLEEIEKKKQKNK